MEPVTIRPVCLADRDQLARMRALLWPDTPLEDHATDVDALLNGDPISTLPVATLVACGQDDQLTGFIEVGLRSHADGCDPARPVAFIEGWFVHEASRGQGIGGELMRAAEAWARRHGCHEMASDTWIDHEASQKAHQALGFQVVDRCIHFRKTL